MQKNKMILGIIAAVVSSLLILSGCTQQNTPSDQNNPPSEDALEQLQQVLAKADTNESVYYELEVSTTVSGDLVQNSTIRIWQKLPYIKEEESSTSGNMTTYQIIIQRPEGTYRYDAEKQRYNVFPAIILPQPSTNDLAKDLLHNQTISTITNETFDGKVVTVIQYNPSGTGNTTIMKMWIWNEKGLPLKALLTSNKEGTPITTEYLYNNYSFEDIPESTFSVS